MIKYYAGNQRHYEVESNEKEYKNYKYWKIEYRNKNDKLHREDGPAVIYSNGDYIFALNGECHRLDGLAYNVNNYKAYFIKNKNINVKTDEEFKKYAQNYKLTAFK
jgi:hypothetical protein